MPRPALHVPTRRQVLLGGVAGAAASVLTTPSATAATQRAAQPVARTTPAMARGAVPYAVDAARVRGWAADTWHSLVRMTDEKTGLAADNIPESLAAADRSGYTSPTNIGGYLWSAVVARELGIIDAAECTKRLVQTLRTVLRMEHHEPSGMYYNWYDEATGAKLTAFPGSGDRIYPFLSSVDNGWLGAALMVVRSADKGAAPLADQIFRRMRWDMFYNPEAPRPGGLMHGGFYDDPPPNPDATFTGNHIGVGPDVWYTKHHYDTTVSETRITSYLGILTGQVPARHYFAMWRTFPASCDWSWHEMQPVGQTRSYLGLDVYEGAYTYRGMHIVPGWGGSMFEELMPDVFVPEASWAPRSWGVNHPLHVRAQREHGLEEAGYGYWGFSPSSDPFGGYREYGVDALGLNPDGYFSDKERTNYDAGFGDCRDGANPTPRYGDGVVTPHAAFLAMMHEPAQAYDNLTRIQTELGAYGEGGFFDAVAVRSGTIARRYLSLDQAMVMGAIGNVLGDNVIRRAFATPAVERVLRPVIGMEEFGAGLA
jgi:putative glucoamylase/uncharacterized protein DUF3131